MKKIFITTCILSIITTSAVFAQNTKNLPLIAASTNSNELSEQEVKQLLQNQTEQTKKLEQWLQKNPEQLQKLQQILQSGVDESQQTQQLQKWLDSNPNQSQEILRLLQNK